MTRMPSVCNKRGVLVNGRQPNASCHHIILTNPIMKRFILSQHSAATTLRTAASVALFATGSLLCHAQGYPQPTLFYDFNNPTGSTVSSVNSSESLDFDSYIYDDGFSIAPSYTAGGLGVSGLSTDRALDLSQATGMGGSSNFGGGATSTGDLSDVPGFQGARSFTMAGWFYATESAITTNSQLINISNASNDGFRLYGHTNGRLLLDYVGDHGRDNFSSTRDSYSTVGEWVFFAVTIDTTVAEGDNLFFYSVDANGELVVNISHRMDLGPLKVGDRSLVLGNFSGPATNRPFQGYLDNFGFWVDDQGAAGALSLEQLDSFRTGGVIPEPEQFAMLSGLLLLICGIYYRHKQRRLSS